MGTPKEKGQYTETFADLHIIGMLQNVSQRHEKDGWDYLDLDMEMAETSCSIFTWDHPSMG